MTLTLPVEWLETNASSPLKAHVEAARPSSSPEHTVTVDSPAMPRLLGLPALRLLRLSGAERLSALDAYTLELRTPGDDVVPLVASANLDLHSLIGHSFTASIRLDGMGGGVREISGLVTDAGFLRREARYNVYEITLRPWLWLATQTTDFKIFQDKNVIDIIDAVLADYPFPVEKRLDAGRYTANGDSLHNEPRAFQVQYGESDFDFIQRLMEEWGIYWFFEYGQGKQRLILCDHVGALRGSENVAYRMLSHAPPDNRTDTETIRRFHVRESLHPGRVVVNDFDFTRPIANLAAANQQPRDTALGHAEVFEWPGDYTDSQHAAHISRTRMEELRAPGTRAEGQGNVRGLACGQTFMLTGHDHEAANREYFVIESSLAITEIGEESGATSYRFDNTFTVQPTTEVFRPPRLTPKPHANGTQTAMVVGPAGEQLWTDEFGRVKVRFHWDRYARNDETDSCWVRVSQAWAGANFGGIYIPRIGQEVIVDFLNGDPDRPLIIGSLYNNLTRPPWELPGHATQSGLISRTIGGGVNNYNGVRFEDRPGREEFHLQAERDMNSTVKNDASTRVGNDAETHIGNDSETRIGNDALTTIGGNAAVSVASALTSSIGGAMVETIGSSMSQFVSAGVTQAIGAGIKQTIGASSEQEVGAGEKKTIGGSSEKTVGAEYKISVAGSSEKTVGSDYKISVVGSSEKTVGSDYKISVSGSGENTVQNEYTVSAGQSLTLKCGQASLTLKSDGTIELSGAKVTIKADDKLDLSGSPMHLNAGGGGGGGGGESGGSKEGGSEGGGGESGGGEAGTEAAEAAQKMAEQMNEVAGEMAKSAGEVASTMMGEAVKTGVEIAGEMAKTGMESASEAIKAAQEAAAEQRSEGAAHNSNSARRAPKPRKP